MGKINVGDLQVGMVIAGEVKNLNGQMLMPKGVSLVEKHIGMLKSWGITEVDVEGVEREEVTAKSIAQLDPETLKCAEVQLQELFRHAGTTHPALKELFSQCVLRYARLQSVERGTR